MKNNLEILVNLASVVSISILAACASREEPQSQAAAHEGPASTQAAVVGEASYVTAEDGPGRFTLAASGQVAPIVVNAADFPGVLRAAKSLQADIKLVTDIAPQLLTDELPTAGPAVLVGTLGKSAFLDQLISNGKLDVSSIKGHWESAILQVVDAPMPGIGRALVIAGSDKRGTIYGIYDLSAQIGVSPWYYWADVPARKASSVYVMSGRQTLGEPAVKYRGIFINDENPSLLGWVNATFGSFNHTFYEKVFELLLRLRGNTLWPAMWGKAFSADDALNPQLADEYGIVMGTAHNEPMMRAESEWSRYGKGNWNYATNGDALREYWTQGIQRMGNYESIVTVGMRGNGDVALSPNPDIPLVESIVADQRQMIANATGKAIETVPQVWTLYKEVQDYYDQGMRVPEDVTLIMSDDNFGNLRKLPELGDTARLGGFGLYYHYDYVGGPRNYKWINTNPLPRVWEQLHLAHEYGVNRVWIVNVGDLKPMELPIEFFLDYAWNPSKWPAERISDYTRLWAERQFGSEHAAAIGAILAKYPKLNARRKPELLDPTTYSLVNYREAARVVAEYNQLATDAQQIYDGLASEYKDAFYQLVLYPVKACANLNDMYATAGTNALYAKQGRASTNDLAARVRSLFATDASLSNTYNKVIAGGKWKHMMDQTHIGYTTWQEPSSNSMPAVQELNLPTEAAMGIAIEGSADYWPASTNTATLPEFSPYQLQPAEYIDVFNRGLSTFEFRVDSAQPYVQVSPAQGAVEKESRVWVSINWQQAPSGVNQVPLTITGPNGTSVVVQAVVNKPDSSVPAGLDGKVEHNGYVAMDAEQYTLAVGGDISADGGTPTTIGGDAGATTVQWQEIADLSRTGSGMTTFPVTAPSQMASRDSPHLEYQLYLFNTSQVKVTAYLSPSLNYHLTAPRYALSFDDAKPTQVAMKCSYFDSAWETRVANNIDTEETTLAVSAPGVHTLKFWRVDPGVVLQKLVVSTGAQLPVSYLGPPTERFVESDAGTLVDAGTSNSNDVLVDAGTPSSNDVLVDAGTPSGAATQIQSVLRVTGGGCDCRQASRPHSDGSAWILLVGALALTRRRHAGLDR